MSHEDWQSDGSVVGSPYWMAPEVIEMSPHVQASDIWQTQGILMCSLWNRSLGCCCIELLTGFPPYFDLNPMSALFKIAEEKSPPLPKNISLELSEFLSKCFKKVPAERASAKELLKHSWIVSNRQSFGRGLAVPDLKDTLKEYNEHNPFVHRVSRLRGLSKDKKGEIGQQYL